MATLILAKKSNGEVIGRCNSNCHNAQSEDCDCICGGQNHGVGRKQAEENTREHYEEWMEAYQKKHPEKLKFRVRKKLFEKQLDLFLKERPY